MYAGRILLNKIFTSNESLKGPAMNARVDHLEAASAHPAPLSADQQTGQIAVQLPEAASPSALIDHILARYHEVHRQQLPELIRMARRVEAVHRDNPHVPAGL